MAKGIKCHLQEEITIFRQDISASGLYHIVQRAFLNIRDTRQARKSSVSLQDALLSALAVFSFKGPSLLSFEIDLQHDDVIAGHVRRLFHIDRIPSDTTMRELIDEIPPQALHEVFTRVFAA